MTKITYKVLFLLFFMAGTALPAGATEPAATLGGLHVMQPWARASIGAGKTGVVYLSLGNHGPADRLIAVETPVAGKAALHGHTEQDGVMKMRRVAAVEVPAGGHAELAPGGLHVMLMGLEAPLAEGTRFPLTLVFEKAGRIEVQVPVLSATATAAGSETHGHGTQGHSTSQD